MCSKSVKILSKLCNKLRFGNPGAIFESIQRPGRQVLWQDTKRVPGETPQIKRFGEKVTEAGP